MLKFSPKIKARYAYERYAYKKNMCAICQSFCQCQVFVLVCRCFYLLM